MLVGFHCHFNHFSDRGKIAHFMPKKGKKRRMFATIHHRNHNHAIAFHVKRKKHLLNKNSFVLLGNEEKGVSCDGVMIR